jgi:hypothetical protein
LENAYSRGGSVTFGGSRVRGNYTPASDLDVGFDGISPTQAGKIIDKASKVEGGLVLERTKIVGGNKPPNLSRINSAPEFFAESGARDYAASDGSMTYGLSGSITVTKDGRYVQVAP